MKRYVSLLALFLSVNFLSAQNSTFTIEADTLYSSSLDNVGGENSSRTMLVYLPPGYEENKERRYPVIYYLHGFTSSDSSNLNWFGTDEKLTFALQNKKIRPFILVVSNQHTLYKGSWYTNSTFTGKWSDFTAKDLVKHIDTKYRTIANRDSRGICGWSMGGHGTIKMAMLYPEVFSSAYALSPALLAFNDQVSASSGVFKAVQEAKSRDDLLKGEFLPIAIVAAGRAFAPNPNNPPFFADMPFSYDGDNLVTNYDILRKWMKQLPCNMLDEHFEDFSKLKAFKIDWGRNETGANGHIPYTARMFSEKLEALGMKHYAEEFIGTHGNKLWSFDGRLIDNVLPFFNANLEFHEE